MGEQLFAAVVRRDETKTLCIAEPLYSSGRHGRLLAGKRGTVSRAVVFVGAASFPHRLTAHAVRLHRRKILPEAASAAPPRASSRLPSLIKILFICENYT